MQQSLLMLFFLLFSNYLFSQNLPCQRSSTLMLTDALLQPVVGAFVVYNEQQSTTDADGKVYMAISCHEPLHLNIDATNFQSIDTLIKPPVTDKIILVMEQGRLALDVVEIHSRHIENVQNTQIARTISSQELKSLKGKNLGEMLQEIPGVGTLTTGNNITKPIVNGMHSNRLLLIENGIALSSQQWGAEHAPEIDGSLADQLVVIKGAESIRYGEGALGGVILIQNNIKQITKKLEGNISLGAASNGRMFNNQIHLKGKLLKDRPLFFNLKTSWKKSGNLKTPDYYMMNSGMEELNYSAQLFYQRKKWQAEIYLSQFNTNIGILQSSHLGSVEDLEYAIALGRPLEDGYFTYKLDAPNQKVKHQLVKAQWQYHVNDVWHANILLSMQHNRRKEFDKRRSATVAIPSLDYTLNTQMAQLSLVYFKKLWKFESGVQTQALQNKKVDGTFSTPLIPDYNAFNFGAYILGKRYFNQLTLDAGLRYDVKDMIAEGYRNNKYYGGSHHYQRFTASISGHYQINAKVNLTSNIGSAWRSPSVNELYSAGLHHGAASIEYGDANLQIEKSLKWINSINIRFLDNKINLNMEPYWHYIQNYIYLNPSKIVEQRINGAFPVYNTQQTNARFIGLDYSAHYDLFKWLHYTIKGSILNAKNLSTGYALPMIPGHQLVNAITINPALKHDWEIKLENVSIGQASKTLEKLEWAPVPDAYSIWNISTNYQFNFRKQQMFIQLGVDNLSNARYKNYMNRLRYFTQESGRNVYLRINYQF